MSEDRPISAWCWVKPKDGEVVPDYPPVPITIIQVDGLYPENPLAAEELPRE